MRTTLCIALLSPLLMLAACGQKGPLYLPDNQPVVVPPASTGAAAQTEEEQAAARARRATPAN